MRRRGFRHPPPPPGSMALPGEIFVGAVEAYRTWAERRKKLHPAGDPRRAPIAQLVVDLDDVRELLEVLPYDHRIPKAIPGEHANELIEYLRFVLGELEAHEAARA